MHHYQLQTEKRVELALKEERLSHKKSIIQKEVETKGIDVQNGLSNDFYAIMEENEIENPFIKLFWQEQKKLAEGNSLAIRYHPMIIRFCISLASKSPSAYDELRDTGLLTLPSRRTLRDYTMMVLFWDAVSILEITCHLKVICATCDGASVNRKFFKCHEHMDDNLSEVVYMS